MIRDRSVECGNIPVSLANLILDMHDEDSNGKLDFDEFYQMSLQQEWLFSRFLKSYCKYLVPAPRREGEDQIGDFIFFFFTYISTNFIESNVDTIN